MARRWVQGIALLVVIPIGSCGRPEIQTSSSCDADSVVRSAAIRVRAAHDGRADVLAGGTGYVAAKIGPIHGMEFDQALKAATQAVQVAEHDLEIARAACQMAQDSRDGLKNSHSVRDAR